MAFLQLWAEAQEWLNMVVSAIIVLLIGLIIGKILGKLSQRGLHEVELNRILGKAGIQFGMEEFVGRLIEYLVYFIAIVIALDQLGVTAIVLYIIIAVILVVLAIAFLLSMKDFIPNFIAGIMLGHKKLFKVGDTIKAGSVSGRVREIGLLETKLVSRGGDIIYVPNANFLRQEIRVRTR